MISLKYLWRLAPALLLLICFSLPDCEALKMFIKPRYIVQNTSLGFVDIFMCPLLDESERGIPLAGCEFSVLPIFAAWEFNQGSASKEYDDARYIGTGLENGDCGITRDERLEDKQGVLLCRVKPKAGGPWIFAKTSYDFTGNPRMAFNLQPQEITALSGSDVTISGTADRNFDCCRFLLPSGKLLDFSTHPSCQEKKKNEYPSEYFGTGLENNQCGMILRNVSSAVSGFIVGGVRSSVDNSSSFDVILLNVLTAPKAAPHLHLNTTKEVFTSGETLHATCAVGESIPVANVTWLLGGDVVRSDDINEAPEDNSWHWNHDPQAIVQHLSYNLTSSDDGKSLVCQAGHLALPSGTLQSESRVIRVSDKP